MNVFQLVWKFTLFSDVKESGLTSDCKNICDLLHLFVEAMRIQWVGRIIEKKSPQANEVGKELVLI